MNEGDQSGPRRLDDTTEPGTIAVAMPLDNRIAQLRQLLELHGGLYQAVRIRCVAGKKDGRWQNLRCDILAFPRGAERASRAGHEYPSVLLLEEWCDPSRVPELVLEAANGLAKIGETAVGFDSLFDDPRLYDEATPPLAFDCPVFRVLIPFQGGCPIETQRLLAQGMPLYRDGNAAIHDWCDDRFEYGRAFGTISVRLPQCRARFGYLSVDEAGLHVEVDGDSETVAKCWVKGAFWSGNGAADIEMLALTAGTRMTVPAPDDPSAIELYLVDKSSAILDRHLEGPGREEPARPRILRDITRMESDQGVVRRAIEKGESDVAEFKTFIAQGHEKMREIYESVVAFANTRGGVIAIGIDDYCKVLGVERDLLTAGARKGTFDLASVIEPYLAFVRKGIREALNRTPDHRVVPVEIDGHTVVAVVVQRGREPPYAMRDNNDIFVRRGPNNVRPHPDHELRPLLLAHESAAVRR